MRVCVTGGRDFADRKLLHKVLDELHKVHHFELLIHGNARGADELADHWAVTRGIERKPYSADWRGDGNMAGPIRNSRMLADGRPHMVVAFCGGSGTQDCVNKAVRHGIPVFDLETCIVKEVDSVQMKLF